MKSAIVNSATVLPTWCDKCKTNWNKGFDPFFDQQEGKTSPLTFTSTATSAAISSALRRPLAISPSPFLPPPSSGFHWAQEWHRNLGYPLATSKGPLPLSPISFSLFPSSSVSLFKHQNCPDPLLVRFGTSRTVQFGVVRWTLDACMHRSIHTSMNAYMHA